MLTTEREARKVKVTPEQGLAKTRVTENTAQKLIQQAENGPSRRHV